MLNSIKVLCVSVFMLLSSSVVAEPAMILTDFGCTFLDGDGGYVSTNDTKSVITMGGKGSNIILKCHASGAANSTGKAVKWNFDNTGRPCVTHFGTTEDWRIVVSADGQATMTCKVHF